MSDYVLAFLETAPLAIAFVAAPLGVAVLGGTWLEPRWPGVGVWAAWAAAVLLLTAIILVSAALYTRGRAPVGLVGQLFLGVATAGILMTPPVLALKKLEARLTVGPRLAVAFLVGLLVTIATAPFTVLLVGCMLTGDCL